MATDHPQIESAKTAYIQANLDLRGARAKHRLIKTEESAQAVKRAEQREGVALGAWEKVATELGDAEDRLAVKAYTDLKVRPDAT
jgi:hypothetical protein